MVLFKQTILIDISGRHYEGLQEQRIFICSLSYPIFKNIFEINFSKTNVSVMNALKNFHQKLF